MILVPNNTNKAYKYVSSTSCNWGVQITTEFEDTNYSKVNVSDDNWFYQTLSNSKPTTVCNYYKFTFNLTSFGISSGQLTDVVMLHEGQGPTGLDGSNATLYFYNVTSGT